ncbi:MAG: heme o synthase [Candidatus Marsarchaeota archaeon]|nr:heme o synthase [Candidatus Marsarchaeota archaeon]MCL5413522.1 heme o synthase [Candidatus Marsarchaeota archaeon]
MDSIRNYASLMQFKIVALLVLSSAAGFAIAYRSYLGAFTAFIFVVIGITFSSSGAEVLNKVLERDIDRKMNRTRQRASVTGKIDHRNGIIVGIVLSAIGIGLGYMVNDLTALMILLGFAFYIIIYTGILKTRSRFNIIVGSLAGSFCVWAGVTAAAGTITMPGFLLGLLIFLWVPGHIWSFAIKYRKDYIRAGVPMLTAVESTSTGTKVIAFFNILMAAFSALLIPYLGVYYIVILAIPLAVLLCLSFKTLVDSSATWILFKFSSVFLTFVFLAVIVARLL